MKSVLAILLATVSLVYTKEVGETSITESNSKLKEREETTERNAPQFSSYNPSGGRGLVYPSTYNPGGYNPNSIYPNSRPTYPNNVIPYDASNPANNPAYNPSANPSGYYPNGYYPSGTNGGGYIGNGFSEAFTARRASSFTRPGSKITFSETVTQVGTGWNRAKSEFVATTSGLFFFSFSVVSDRYSHCRVSLKRNGLDVVSAFGDASGFQMGSQSAALNLSAGDRVYLQLQEGRLYEVSSSRAYTTFTGFKIQ